MPSQSQPSPFWGTLMLVPVSLTALSLLPRFGRYRVGLAPEWFLHQIRGFEDFGDKAIDVRWGIVAVFAVSAAAAFLWWVVAVRGWRVRLQTFNVRRVSNYRMYVAWLGLGACISAIVVAAAAIIASPALQAGGITSWTIFAIGMGLLAVLQFFAFVWGLPTTLRLYRGY